MSRWSIGSTVPWTVSWTGEDSFSLRESQDFPGYVDLMQAQNPGVGTPRFAALNVTRQRLGMAGHLCHVCGKRTLKNNRTLFPVESGGFVTVDDGSLRYVATVSPLHLACAKRAQTACPHLSHLLAQPVAYPSEETILKPTPEVPEGMQALAATLPKGMKVVFSCVRVFGPRFTRTVQRMRHEAGIAAA